MEAYVQATYAGLDLAIEQFFGATTRWVSDNEAGPSKVLAARFPGVPNLGDMTRIDWAAVEPVDILAAGTPCQDLSDAGKKGGMTEGTRSNLWVDMREAITVIRPQIVIWENVRGASTAYAKSELELEQGLLGETFGHARPALRALGRVLGDLSDLGYDAGWAGVRASDVGAPHRRFRIFVVAYTDPGWVTRNPTDLVRERGREPGTAAGSVESGVPDRVAEDRGGQPWHQRGVAASAETGSGRARADTGGRGRTSPTNPDSDGYGAGQDPRRVGHLDGGDEGASRERERARSVVGGGSAADAAHPERGVIGGRADLEGRDAEGRTAPGGHRGSSDERNPWGAYQPAIRRWEHALGRLAPPPTRPSSRGTETLSPVFVEWMMGLPEGWVTDPQLELTRGEQLRILGNGVVPQQAYRAFEIIQETT